MEYYLKDGKRYEISYSQELQNKQIAILNRVRIVGIVGIILMVIGLVFLGVIIFTDVLQDSLRMMVC